MVQNKTVIRVLNKEHGEKVIKWFKSQGINTDEYTGEYVGNYYGLDSDGTFANWKNLPFEYTVIELPLELPKRGDRILVWQSNESDAEERTFLAYVENSYEPVICVSDGFEFKLEANINEKVPVISWQNYKLIEPVKEVELTLDEIAAKFNISVSQLKIKK